MLYNIIVRKTKLIILGGMYNMKVYVVKEVYDVTEKDENVRVFKTRTSAENFTFNNTAEISWSKDYN